MFYIYFFDMLTNLHFLSFSFFVLFLLSVEDPPLKRARTEEEGKYLQNKESIYSQDIIHNLQNNSNRSILLEPPWSPSPKKTKYHDVYVHYSLFYFPLFFFIETNLFRLC